MKWKIYEEFTKEIIEPFRNGQYLPHVAMNVKQMR